MSSDSGTHPEPFISFLVCTFHREDLLARCLQSILAQHHLTDTPCEVVVVDNSDEGTAAQAVAAIAGQAPVPVRYVPAHPPNIAVARNAGVAAARAEFIAMIDDDMTVDPLWLSHALAALRTLPHDVFSGPVSPVYEDPGLASPQSDAFFNRRMAVTAPTDLRIMGPDRTRTYIPATSNSIFRRERCFSTLLKFDEHYGKSGGEDVDLFCRLESQGRTFAWLPDINTQELVPARRCEPSYLEKRSYVGGQIFASTYIRNSSVPLWTSLKVALIAYVQWALLAPRFLVARLAGQPPAAPLRFRLSAIRGKLGWRTMLPMYAQESRAGGARS